MTPHPEGFADVNRRVYLDSDPLATHRFFRFTDDWAEPDGWMLRRARSGSHPSFFGADGLCVDDEKIGG